jgi:hypothetical protein
LNEHELPDLRILPADALVLHEGIEAARIERLTTAIRRDGILKNPPIVAPLPGTERYVVLDGANRTTSLRAMGLPHLLVQCVDYDEVQLDTWNHIVTGVDEQALYDTVRSIVGLTLQQVPLAQARALLTARRCLAYLISPSGQVEIIAGGSMMEEEVRLLNEVVHSYKGIARIYRIKTDNLSEQEAFYDQIAAAVVFPRFTPADIIGLATTDRKLPTGITRHIIPRRALRINYSLERLADPDATLDQKNQALLDFIRERLRDKGVRYYQESTILFDE